MRRPPSPSIFLLVLCEVHRDRAERDIVADQRLESALNELIRPGEVESIALLSTGGEVIASTNDQTIEDHVRTAKMAIERAKRLVESGHPLCGRGTARRQPPAIGRVPAEGRVGRRIRDGRLLLGGGE